MLNRLEMSEDEDFSYDVEAFLLTILLIKQLILFAMKFTFIKKLQPICKRSIFKKLLLKFTTEYTFSINEKLCKQIDGVSMGLLFYQIAS